MKERGDPKLLKKKKSCNIYTYTKKKKKIK